MKLELPMRLYLLIQSVVQSPDEGKTHGARLSVTVYDDIGQSFHSHRNSMQYILAP